MTRLSLALLGPFQVTLNGKSADGFESDRVRALLAFLAVEADRPHRRERLAGLLWPDWPDRSALTNLRNALSNLRKAIGDRKTTSPILTVDRETIQFNRAGDCQVDVQSFQSLTAADQPENRVAEGIALYRGPFLEGFGLKDSAPFEEWVQTTREQLQRHCLLALTRVAEYHEQRGEMDQARECAWRQVDLAPWYEEAHQHLMRLLALSGQRSAALAQYETCRNVLQQELGVEPAPETVALYERIRDGQLGGHAEPATTVVRAESVRQTGLPVWLTPFVGRQEILTDLCDRLRDPTCRLLTLVGPGGSGKTRLAVEVASKLSTFFPQGVHFVPLASLQSPENIVPAVAQALGYSFDEQEDPQQELAHYLHKKNMLLVLDNFEHLIVNAEPDREDGIQVVTMLLQSAPSIKIFITSRVGLNMQGEQLVQIPGLGYPAVALTNPSEALEYGAVQLFIQNAQRVRPGFEPTEDELQQIVEICCLVQGMPLGLMLASSWMRLLAPAEIAAQLATQKLDFLEAEWHDVPERQRSMRAVFDYSWRLLNDRERQMLMGLSVFRGGFTFAAAQQVATIEGQTPTLRDLMRLINSSMLQRTASGRYQMHELLRQFANEKLVKSPGGEQPVRDRHAAYYAAALRQWAIGLQGPRQQDALARLDTEIDNLHAAWSWAVKHDQLNRLRDGLNAMGQFYVWRARYTEGKKAFDRIVDKFATMGSAQNIEQLKVWTTALIWQARFHQRLGHTESAREKIHTSLVLLEEQAQAGDDVRREKALALQVIGEIELQLGNSEHGIEPLTQSLQLYRELGDRLATANGLRYLGRLVERMGDYAQAARLHQESVEICRALGAPHDTVNALVELFVDLQFMGQHHESKQLLSEAMTLAQQLGDRALITSVRYCEAMFVMDDDPAASLAILEDCLAVHTEMGKPHNRALVLMRVGEAYLHLGKYDQAHGPLQETLNWYQEVENWWGVGTTLRFLGFLALVEGKCDEAQQLFQGSVLALQRSGARADVGMTLASLVLVAAMQSDFELARAKMVETIHVALKFRKHLMPVHVLIGAALCAAKQGQADRALEYWSVIASAPLVVNAHYYQELYRESIAPVVARLSRKQAAAVEERARSLDRWNLLEQLLAELNAKK